MYELKYKIETILDKNGKEINIIKWYIEIEINGKKVPYILNLDYKQSEFLQALIL